MSALEVAVRAWVEPLEGDARREERQTPQSLPSYALVVDCETTTDKTQRLLFGSYRILCLDDPDHPPGSCREEGLIHADDLPQREPQAFAALERYAAEHEADLGVLSYRRRLKLVSRSEFMRTFYRWAYKKRALVVGFNLPFDLSRLAVSVGDARRSYGGGFSLVFWDRECADGTRRPNDYRPRLVMRSLNSKQHLFRFTDRYAADPEDYEEEHSDD